MNKLHEIEFKILLSKEVYANILKDYQEKVSMVYSQTNYYFVHPLLSANKLMLRIRKKEAECELTLKEKDPVIGSIETNITIDEETLTKIYNQEPVENEIFTILSKYGIKQSELVPSASLTTYRHDIPLPLGMLSVDKNSYFDTTDYELEFEVLDPNVGLEEFFHIIKPYHLQYTANCESKVVRVLKRGELL